MVDEKSNLKASEAIDALFGQIAYSSFVGAIVAFYLATVPKEVREAFRKSINEICDRLNEEGKGGDIDIGGISISIEEVEEE